jgi:hypothetical protein
LGEGIGGLEDGYEELILEWGMGIGACRHEENLVVITTIVKRKIFISASRARAAKRQPSRDEKENWRSKVELM